MRATLRTLSAAGAKTALKLIKRCAAGVCGARGAKYEIDVIAEYPPLVNESGVNRLFGESYSDLFGKGQVELTEQEQAALERVWERKGELGHHDPTRAEEHLRVARGRHTRQPQVDRPSPAVKAPHSRGGMGGESDLRIVGGSRGCFLLL